MKLFLNRPVASAMLLALVWLAGLAFGVAATVVYPLYSKQKPSLLSQARGIAQEHLEEIDDTLRYLTSPTTRMLIYDAAGNRLRSVLPDDPARQDASGVDYDALLSGYYGDIIDGKERFAVTPSWETPRDLTHFWMIAGVPIRKEGSAVGAVFLIKNLENVQEALLGYCICFTVFFWICAGILLSAVHKKRKLDELKQNYVANVTHTLKTPSASIKALAETLCDGVETDPDRQRVLYGMILREANLQGHMIRDILELSKLQTNGKDFTKSAVDAGDIFDPVVEKYAAVCDCSDISLHVSDELARLPVLFTNAECVREIMGIFLDNALKFVDEGGGIRMEGRAGKKQAVICVRDDGIGISKEDLPHVFERFYKAGRERNESGSGLGLAIAKEIADGLKEKIWAESEPGNGAAFFLTVSLR